MANISPSTRMIIARKSVAFDEGKLFNAFTDAPLHVDETTPLMEPHDVAVVLCDRRTFLSSVVPHETLYLTSYSNDVDLFTSPTNQAPPYATSSMQLVVHQVSLTTSPPPTSLHLGDETDDRGTGSDTTSLPREAHAPLLQSDRSKRLPLRLMTEDSALLGMTQSDIDDPSIPSSYPSDYGHYALWTSFLYGEAPCLLHPTMAATFFIDDPLASLPSNYNIVIPRTMRATILSPQGDRLKTVVKTKYDSIKSRNALKTIHVLGGQSVLSTKWDFNL
jgi:hypothetical protein